MKYKQCVLLLLFCRIPSPGYFNQDDTIDFMVKMNVGPGFPTYYHSIVSVLQLLCYIVLAEKV